LPRKQRIGVGKDGGGGEEEKKGGMEGEREEDIFHLIYYGSQESQILKKELGMRSGPSAWLQYQTMIFQKLKAAGGVV
jgi:hypothetical protein